MKIHMVAMVVVLINIWTPTTKTLQNLVDEEMNRSHQLIQDEDVSVFDGEEYDYGEDGVEEEEGAIHDDNYTDEQYTADPVEVVKKSTKKLAGQIKYVTFGFDKYRKTKPRYQSKRVDCKARVNFHVLNDGSCIVSRVILEHNHELEPALPRFLPYHRELSRTLKRSLVAHDIAGLRPSKSIRLLEVEAGGPDRMLCTPKDYRNYILQQRRL
ncbi:hypothetical protein T459_01579 [Capsicum annuum]|uniref:Uncharacterized protein n=1 Tax=Capsicum annuum TaxID=4072 RepID=A0A2G3AHI9_CAPAN|nr:hypothetical protein T459_01579 [Capsicum annuum]